MCDSLLKTKKPNGEDLSDLLVRLSAHGPENYFGVFRRPEGCFYKSVQDLPNRSEPLQADQASAYACYFSMAMPLALYQQRPSKTLMQYCIDAALLLSRHPWEVVGAAVTGFITVRLLNEEGLPEAAVLLKEAAEFCETAEAWYRENYPDRFALAEKNPEAMSRTLSDLADQYSKSDSENLPAWICGNASSYIKTKIVHATQGHALTILPLGVGAVVDAGAGFCEYVDRDTQSRTRGGQAGGIDRVLGRGGSRIVGYPAGLAIEAGQCQGDQAPGRGPGQAEKGVGGQGSAGHGAGFDPERGRGAPQIPAEGTHKIREKRLCFRGFMAGGGGRGDPASAEGGSPALAGV